MTSTAVACVKGQPGPHYYVCGRPGKELVHCVCRNCGDEKDLPAMPARRRDQMSHEEWQKFKRLRSSRGKDMVMVEHSAPEEDEISTELGQNQDEINPETVPKEGEISPPVAERKEEGPMVQSTVGGRHGFALRDSAHRLQKKAEYDGKKDEYIAVWRRTGSVNKAARELGIPTTSLRGKLEQWGLVDRCPSHQRRRNRRQQTDARHNGNYRHQRYLELETQKEAIIACWRKHGGNINLAAKELKIQYSTVKGKLVQWQLVPGWPSYRKRCPSRLGGDPTGIEAQAQMNSLLTSLYDERARIDSQIKSVRTAMDLLKLKEVTTK